MYYWKNKDTDTIFSNTKEIIRLLEEKNKELISGYSSDSPIEDNGTFDEVNLLLGKNLEEDEAVFDFIIKGLKFYNEGRVSLQELIKYLK